MDEYGHIVWCHEICDDLILHEIYRCQGGKEYDEAFVDEELLWVKGRQINDHAYFCLLAFQLEQFVKDSFVRLCDARSLSTTGVDRIAWERVKASKADFLTMVRFLLPRDTHLYDRARELYRDRNKIAHEAELSLPIQMSATQRDIKEIATRIHSALSTLEAAP
ncbi:MAG: hypothetical protein WCJ64_12550 [Rhodospirillaceae bacterium]